MWGKGNFDPDDTGETDDTDIGKFSSVSIPIAISSSNKEWGKKTENPKTRGGKKIKSIKAYCDIYYWIQQVVLHIHKHKPSQTK